MFIFYYLKPKMFDISFLFKIPTIKPSKKTKPLKKKKRKRKKK